MKSLVGIALLTLTAAAGCANEDLAVESSDQAATAGSPSTSATSSTFTTPNGTVGTFTFEGPEAGAARATLLTLTRAGKTVQLECGLSGETSEPDFGAECRLRGGAAWWPFPLAAEETCDLQIVSASPGGVIVAASCKTSRSVRATPTSAPRLTKVPLTQPQQMLLELVADAPAWTTDARHTFAQIGRGPLTVVGTPDTDPVPFVTTLRDAARRKVGQTVPFLQGATGTRPGGSCTVEEVIILPHAYTTSDPILPVHTGEGEAVVRGDGVRTDDSTSCTVLAKISWRDAGGGVADATTLDARIAQAAYHSSY